MRLEVLQKASVKAGPYGEGYGITIRQHFAGLIFQQFMAGAVLPPGFDASEQLALAAARAVEAADSLLYALSDEAANAISDSQGLKPE